MKKILFTTNVPAPYTVEFFEQLSLKFDLTVVYERKTAANREKEWFSEKGKSYEEIYLNGMNYGAEASFSLKIIGYLKKLMISSLLEITHLQLELYRYCI